MDSVVAVASGIRTKRWIEMVWFKSRLWKAVSRRIGRAKGWIGRAKGWEVLATIAVFIR